MLSLINHNLIDVELVLRKRLLDVKNTNQKVQLNFGGKYEKSN